MSVPTEQLRIVMVGHVDHGKSTLVGRLLHDTGRLPEGKLAELERAARRRGMPFEWANLMDALQAERDQNITIDTAQIWFRTERRRYVIIDAPGHKEFLKNMVTGAAQADAALLVIDAQEGIQENSRRHGYLLGLLGIRQLAVLVNKMDLVAFDEERFRQIEADYRDWLASIGVDAKLFIPLAARSGENVAAPSPQMPWWTGPTVLGALEAFDLPAAPEGQPLRFPVQDVYRFDDRRILVGRVEAGRLRVGDRLMFSPTGKGSVVKSIERWNAPARPEAETGESIGVTLEEQLFVDRGAVGVHPEARPYELTRFKARVFWLGREPLRLHRTYRLKLVTQESECEVEKIEKILDAASLAPIIRPSGETFVGRHEAAELTLRTRRVLAFDPHSSVPVMGRFVLLDGTDVAGGGIVADAAYLRPTTSGGLKSENVYWSLGKITPQARALRNGHAGRVLWLTGLPASGKSTLATELERELFHLGRHVYVLDGDNVRHGLCADLGFSAADRSENIRRVGQVARLFADAGFICVTAFISPLRSDRALVRAMLPPGAFVEVYVNAPLEVCEDRDPKGLYAKARAGQVKEFTGISAPYEPPAAPELELRTGECTVGECVAQVLEYLRAQETTAAS